METSLDAEPTSSRSRPVDSSERVVLLDVLRGFALGGVFLSNVFDWFSGRVFLPPERVAEEMSRPSSIATYLAFSTFVFGKFLAIFAFLFGLGFYAQLSRVEARGHSFVRLYLRRIAILFLIGAVHTVFLWYGDILHTYAFVALGLLLFRKQSDRSLIVFGVLLGVVFVPLLHISKSFLPLLWASQQAIDAAQAAEMAQFAQTDAATFKGLSSSSYPTMVWTNLMFFWVFSGVWMNTVGICGDVLGKFLLGYAAGRRKVFEDVEAHRHFFRRVLGWGLGIAGAMRVLTLALQWAVKSGKLAQTSIAVRLVLGPAFAIGTVAMAAFYVAAITLLFQREKWRRFFMIYAPAGRMALTNYLMQSVIAVLIFNGVGLGRIGNIGLGWTVVMPLTVFALQMVASYFWLRRFRFGPVEWAWRSLTYGRQPMRLDSVPQSDAQGKNVEH